MFEQLPHKPSGKTNAGKNALVSKMPIQRAVGFEFEIGAYEVVRKIHPSTDEASQEPSFKFLNQRELILKTKNFDLQADIDEVGHSDLEIVTPPVEETQEGYRQLKEMLHGIQALILSIPELPHTLDKEHKFIDIQALLLENSTEAPADIQIVVHKDIKSPIVFPQATAGIRIDKMTKLFEDLSLPPTPSHSSVERRKAQGVRFLASNVHTGSIQNLNAHALYRIPRILHRKIPAFETAFGIPLSAEARGLIALILFYLIQAHPGTTAYPKSFSYLISRTDFAKMFRLLPENERDFFKKNRAENWVGLIQQLLDKRVANLSEPVFKEGVYLNNPQANHRAMDSLSKEMWIREIPEGRDLLTQRHFPDRRKSYKLDSMGSLGDQVDVVLGQQAPIVEFRVGYKQMSAEEAVDYADKVFKYIYSLNRGRDYYYGEPFGFE